MHKNFAASLLTVTIFFACLGITEAAQYHRGPQQKTYKSLPKGNQQIAHRGRSYYYSAGRFYSNRDGLYVSIAAPVGAIVTALPTGYVSFGVGPSRYFYFDYTYYRRIESGYEVIDEPENAQQSLITGSDEPVVYPAAGQSDTQLDQDKYECHAWARSETSFDPTDSGSDPLLRSNYYRAIEACLEGRHYVVK